MKVKAVLLGLVVAAFAAAGATAQNGPPPPPPGGTTGPGGYGGGRPGGPPGRQQNPNGQSQGQGESEGSTGPQKPGGPAQGNRGGDQVFRQQLQAAGYHCLPRPVFLRGSVTAVGSDSFTVHPLRLRTDVTVKVLAATMFFRMGPAKLSDLVVGDNVLVLAAPCRSTTGTTGATGATGTGRTPPTLVARRVGARPAATTHS